MFVSGFRTAILSKGKTHFHLTLKNMKPKNRRGYHYEDIFYIKQWILIDDLDVENMSYFRLEDSIVVQLFKYGIYVGCYIAQDTIRIKDGTNITFMPLSALKQKNNGKLYDEATA